MRVLIADDVRALRTMLRTMVELEPGFEVVGEAATGQDAVDACRTLGPDLVIMDFDMPVMTGLQATAVIVSERPGTVVVALSSLDTPELAETFRAAGAVAYLDKMKLGQLADLLHEVAGDHVSTA